VTFAVSFANFTAPPDWRPFRHGQKSAECCATPMQFLSSFFSPWQFSADFVAYHSEEAFKRRRVDEAQRFS
jgi:hypothetical protein